MVFEKFDSDYRIEEFYNLLKLNLLKHNTSPVHSLTEILDLKRNRLFHEIEFFGVITSYSIHYTKLYETVDLDLLWVEGHQLSTAHLILPHPRMFERAFVLVPLADIVPTGEASGLYRRVHDVLEQMDDKGGVRFWKACNWVSASVRSGS